MIDREKQPLYRALLIIVVISLLLLAPLMPQWTLGAVVTYVGLWVVMVFPLLYLSNPTRFRGLMRIAAAFVAIVFIIASVDQVRSLINSQGAGFQLNSPLTGLLVIGLPALWYAITGKSRVIDEHEQYYEDSEEPD